MAEIRRMMVGFLSTCSIVPDFLHLPNERQRPAIHFRDDVVGTITPP